MIADDDAGIRSALAQLLRDAGYRVRAVGSGEELMAMARGETPDAVLLDLAMPGADGIETARSLRALEDMADVPIIAATSSWLGERPDLLAPAGFTASLRKPFGGAAVLELLASAVDPGSEAALA